MNNSFIALVVKPVVGQQEADDIRRIKPPVEIPDYSLWLWLALACVLAAVAGYLYWRWRKNRPQLKAPVVVIPPHVRARDRLKTALALIGQPRLFAFAVSDALRLYLEERFELHAPERTTEEFLLEMQTAPHLEERHKLLLGDFLARCDLVKFARYQPGEQELRDLFDAAMRLVDETQAPALLAPALEPQGNAPV
jgi:hypothetical protein